MTIVSPSDLAYICRNLQTISPKKEGIFIVTLFYRRYTCREDRSRVEYAVINFVFLLFLQMGTRAG